MLRRARMFVEHPPQTRVEGEVQRLAPDHPVEELWCVVAGLEPGRHDGREVTVFDSVGLAIENFSALRYVRGLFAGSGIGERLALVADPDEPRGPRVVPFRTA